MSDFYVPGGTLKPGAASYIERNADDELYNALLTGEYCTVLTTRQMGKSSLMARTAARLREQAIACATVDLQGKGDKFTPPEQWYYGVAKQIADGLGLPPEWIAWWKRQQMLPPAQRLTDLCAEVILKHISGPVVVFVDEVDWTIDLPYSDEFFAAIRSCFNRRATDPPFARLTFVLLGSASPAQLIKSATRTPFNIGRGIELTDFTAEEARQFAAPLGEEGEQIIARILFWTDDHPYLTQMLCSKVAEYRSCDADDRSSNGERAPNSAVDSIVQSTLLSPAARQQENNLKFVGDRLTQGTRDIRRVLRTYHTVLRGKPVKDEPTSPVHTSLRLSGAVKPDTERRLRVRNQVYEQVFNERWVREKMPADVRLIVGTAATVVLLAMPIVWYLTIFPRPYIEALETANNDVQVAYNAYDSLHKPLHRAKADELLAQFFERRDDRDSAILLRARAGEGARLAALLATDYPLLRRTLRLGGHIYSFSPDGKLVATVSEDNAVLVFDAATGREVSRLAHKSEVYAVAFSPDGRLVATGSETTAAVFEVATGREVSRLAHKRNVYGVALSLDGKRAATVSEDGTVRVLDTATGRPVCPDTIRAPSGMLFGLALSPDGKLVAVGFKDNALVFEAATRREVSLLPHKGEVYAVAFSPDGRLVATGSDTACVSEAATGRVAFCKSGLVWVFAVTFSPDGKLVAIGSGDNSVRVLEAATGRELLTVNNESPVSSLAFSPDGKLLATGNAGTVRVFDATAGLPLPGCSQPLFYHVSLDGKRAATISEDGTVRVFDTATGNGVSRVSRLASDGRVYTTVALSLDGKRAATMSENRTVRVFDTATGGPVSGFSIPNRLHRLFGLALSPDGKLVAIGFDDNALVFEAATGREVSRLAQNFTRGLAVAFSPDGRLVALGSEDKTMRVFEAATGRVVSVVSYQSAVSDVAFSSNGELLVTRTGSAIYALPNHSRFTMENPRGSWLHLYQRSGNNWRPVANRYLSTIWGDIYLPHASAHCPRCVEAICDLSENQIKLDRINFEEYPPPIQGDPKELVAEWSAKLGLKFDQRGHIVPVVLEKAE